MRKTKIICTLGPSTDNEEIMRQLMLSGMNVARFNFSHADYEEHMQRFKMIKRLRNELDLPVATLLDTKGPEIRIKKFKEGKISLTQGQKFTLTTEEIEGTQDTVSVTYKSLPLDVEIGSTVLIDDGLVEMTVIEKDDTKVICEVKNEGVISDNKGVNLPGSNLSMPFISEKDREDIIFGAKNGFDFIAASFARCADDIRQVRKILKENNGEFVQIIAKIENMQGVDNIDEIIEAADGIMIARGDMGVEIPGEEVPVIQKMIIKKVYKAGKPVITATQMLDSMIKNPRPTRAETTDVANAIYDGTSAIMLSGETAAGKYPVQALQTMARIAKRTEEDIDFKKRFRSMGLRPNPDVTEAISHATCTTAHDLNAAAIITVTKSGRTARKISKFRPACPILGCATHPQVCRQLNLSWGVYPIHIREEEDTFELFDHAVKAALERDLVKEGDLTVITAGVPVGISGNSNLVKVQIAGERCM
ncbi:pyruvate kinase [Lachnospiraceae bacterium WCA-693-APC-MOT-I]|uniref:Pyruvate kinase n=1 Tax=Velocimicrobium porci TaxID=2606634 RepID=A0A6L5XUD3_9FIRM|nr:pyruvate kinase [Velocimicrobium porci]MSS62430.1 pyruvate kinase [Velocimicrobium porci]